MSGHLSLVFPIGEGKEIMVRFWDNANLNIHLTLEDLPLSVKQIQTLLDNINETVDLIKSQNKIGAN